MEPAPYICGAATATLVRLLCRHGDTGYILSCLYERHVACTLRRPEVLKSPGGGAVQTNLASVRVSHYVRMFPDN